MSAAAAASGRSIICWPAHHGQSRDTLHGLLNTSQLVTASARWPPAHTPMPFGAM